MAYKNLIGIGKYPLIVLNLEIPPADVDVNVHPTKKEVRYKNTNQIFNFIQSSIIAGLSNYVEVNNTTNINSSENNSIPTNSQNQNVVAFSHVQKDFIVEEKEDSIYISDEKFNEMKFNNQQRFEPNSQKQFFNEPVQPLISQENIIGQYKNTYILIEKEDGLEIIDQHIAEERYIYEKLSSEKNIVSQMLFISDVLKITASEAEIIKENIAKFEKFGYGIDFLKEDEIIFRKVPQVLAKVDPKEILTDILSNIESDIDGLEEKILITTSCKAAVKAGHKLSLWEMQEIIKKWRLTKMPYTCPHGRPITKTINHKQIAGFFQRNA